MLKLGSRSGVCVCTKNGEIERSTTKDDSSLLTLSLFRSPSLSQYLGRKCWNSSCRMTSGRRRGCRSRRSNSVRRVIRHTGIGGGRSHSRGPTLRTRSHTSGCRARRRLRNSIDRIVPLRSRGRGQNWDQRSLRTRLSSHCSTHCLRRRS